MTKYRKKPIVVEAVQWDGKVDTANHFIGDQFGVDWWYAKAGEGAIVIHVLGGVVRVEVGDWIIRGIEGEFYPCKTDIFDATYELVE